MFKLKVVGIVGSPRREGHTARLVEAVLSGAREAGHDAEVFYLGDLDIGPIEAEGRRLVYPDDDMVRLHPHIESMGALVLGTPIYYDHVSSAMKTFIDRLHFYSRTHGEEYRRRFPNGVKCVNVITYDWDEADAYDDVLDWMRVRMEHYWGMKVVASLKAEGTGRRPVEKRADLLERAREIGRSL